jgi:prophage antirepressor-like protein
MSYKCDICNKFYASYKSRWCHKNKFHKNESNNVVIANVNNVNTNVNTITNVNIVNKKIIKCENCSTVFSSRQAKYLHKKKACKNNPDKKLDNNIDKKLEEFKNNILELLKKEVKIHPKTLQKINKNLINNSQSNQSETIKINNCNHSGSENKIIQSKDKKYLFDFNNNLLLESFNNKPIKYFYFNNQFYFKGKDVALMLDYDNPEQTIKINVHEDDKININELFQGGYPPGEASLNISKLLNNEDPQTIFINESGFYSIILSSKKEEAIQFKKWVTSEILPSIRKYGSYNITDNYSMCEENLDNYKNKDCVYIINIKDNIYKFGYSSHIFKRLQTHKTNLNYLKIIKIYDFDNINKAIKLEGQIKKLVKAININVIYFNHVEIFEVNIYNLQNIINKIDEFYLNINKNKIDLTNKMEMLKLENENLKLKFELLKIK